MASIQKLGKSRKGVSPLVATVLLIAFAVALGAVVMNWGKVGLEETLQIKEICEDINLNWYVEDGKSQVCYDEQTIKFTLENGATNDIIDLKLIAIALNDIYVKDRTRIGLRKSDVRNGDVNFDLATYGTIKEIRIVPVLEIEEKTEVCPPDTALKIQNPSRC